MTQKGSQVKLTDNFLKDVERREKIYKVYDGLGLWLEVPPRGNLRWRYKFKFQGKEKRLSVGLYPDVTIEVARNLRDELKGLLEQGVDPSLKRKQTKAATSAEITELTREQLVQRILDLESTISYIRRVLIKSRDYICNKMDDKNG